MNQTMRGGGRYVMGLDVGTTTVTSNIYDVNGRAISETTQSVPVTHSKPGWVEIDPDHLWETVMSVLRDCLTESGLGPADISSLGISCQRGTFTCWSADTGRHYHNLVSWQDLRSDGYVTNWNSSFSLRLLRLSGKVLNWITRLPRFKAASIYTLKCSMVPMRLLWMFDHVPHLREDAGRGEVMFGCVESWLIYKMTGKHITEVSSISATGLFDPFTMQYGGWIFSLMRLPLSIMPKVVNSVGDHFGETNILGGIIPIRAVLADQSASVFGSGCHQVGSAKITMGTGSFLDIVTTSPHASMKGLIPLVAWKIGNDIKYLAEGSIHDTGVVINWAREHLDLDINNPPDLSKINANAVFVPGFYSGYEDSSTTAGFVGINSDTSKDDLLRAVLESVAFSQKKLVDAFLSETDYKFNRLVVDGGVARNDSILQMISDLTRLPVYRPISVEMSVWGAAALGGLQVGLWTDKEQLSGLQGRGDTFIPKVEGGPEVERYRTWLDACLRMSGWSSHAESS